LTGIPGTWTFVSVLCYYFTQMSNV